jgi:hypothetical protein
MHHQPTKSAPPQPPPARPDPYYGHESTARLCGRFITHLFCGMTTHFTSHLTLSVPVITLFSHPKGRIFEITTKQPSPNIQQSYIPMAIDICSISSHTQAEALVQRTQQSILDMDGTSCDDEPLSRGQSLLSAKLAVYEESGAGEAKSGQDPHSAVVQDNTFVQDEGGQSGSCLVCKDFAGPGL